MDMFYQKFRFIASLTALFFLTLFLLIPFPLCAQREDGPIRVAARVCPPFVIKDTGQYSGISIYLWDKIAESKGLEYTVEEYGLDEMLETVVQDKADIAVSCLSMTQKREEIIYLSHPFFETHLSIAVKQQGFLHTLKNFFFNKKLLFVVGLIVGVAAMIGGIFYWSTR
jgi:polar amino acid transport system substrate-binding protein